jgi:hypothetical protein
MLSDKQVEILAIALLIGFFCVLLPALMIARMQATRRLLLALKDNPTSEGIHAAVVRKRRIDRVLTTCLFIAVTFVLFGMIFGT